MSRDTAFLASFAERLRNTSVICLSAPELKYRARVHRDGAAACCEYQRRTVTVSSSWLAETAMHLLAFHRFGHST